ncbi:MAG: YjbF family lipoprotein [Proteobacteria bacterium]|nr:YjbF family lipoprotein [Pseudomonadota bacterium]
MIIGAAATLAGCGDVVRVPRVLTNVYDAARLVTVGIPDIPLSRDQVTKIPYASMGAKIGKGPRSLMILAHVKTDGMHWVSADRAILVTRGGRVVKTAGLPENLRDTRYAGRDPVDKQLHRLEQPSIFQRTLDFDVDNYFGLVVESTFERLAEETITIVEIDFKLILVRERVRAQTINWDHDNFYWVDAFDGFVWKSRQHIARSFAPVDIEILKPPAANAGV